MKKGLSRRLFIQRSVTTGIGLAALNNNLSAFSYPAYSGYSGTIKKPEWLKSPIVSKGSNQEPLVFQIRRGGLSIQAKENYLQSHSAQNVKAIKEFGGTFFMSHVFKGFGLEAEKPDIELAKKMSPLLHQNGIKMGTYVGSSIGYETFLVEMPEAEEWLVTDYLGQPVTYEGQYFRRRPYFAHKGYRNYIKRVVEIAINEIGSDLI